MKRILFTLTLFWGIISSYAGGLDFYRFMTDGRAYATQIPETVSGLLCWLEYNKALDGSEIYELHFLCRNKPASISIGRKFLLKLNDGTVQELVAEDESEVNQWIGNKLEGAYKNLSLGARLRANGGNVVVNDYFFHYTIPEEVIKHILNINIEKFRIETDQDNINSKEGERLCAIIRIGYESIQKVKQKNEQKDVYKDF